MAYTNNIPLIEENLSNLGVNIEAAKRIVLSGGAGFTLNYSHLEGGYEIISAAKSQARTQLYSWLNKLGVKKQYKIRLLQNGVQVSRKQIVNMADGSAFSEAVMVTTARGGMAYTEADTGLCGVMKPEEDFDIGLLEEEI